MNIFKWSSWIISLVIIVFVVWESIFLNVAVSETVVPTLVNGITSSMSIVAGFFGVIIGIMWRDIRQREWHEYVKIKTQLLTFLFSLAIPIFFLLSTYLFLTMGYYLFAVKYSLSGLILTLYTFIMLMIFVAKQVDSEIEQTNPHPRTR